MSSILDNPELQAAIEAQETSAYVLRHMLDRLIAERPWSDMPAATRTACLHRIVGESDSQTELCQRLDAFIGAGNYEVRWKDIEPNNQVLLETQMIVKALGGLVAKSGALVSVNTYDDVY